MTPTETWTVGRLLQWTADYLKSHGSDSPRLDAEVLLAEVLHCQRIQLYTTFDTPSLLTLGCHSLVSWKLRQVMSLPSAAMSNKV